MKRMTFARLSTMIAAAALTGCPSADAPDQPVPTHEVPSSDPAPAPAPSTPQPPATATAAPTAAASTASTASAGPSWVGSWQSNSCGERKYVRQITLTADGGVVGKDLVSPCPPKVACVWSGIVDWTGKYSAQGKTARISDAKPKGGGGKIALPSELVWNDAAGAPAEGDCVYSKR